MYIKTIQVTSSDKSVTAEALIQFERTDKRIPIQRKAADNAMKFQIDAIVYRFSAIYESVVLFESEVHHMSYLELVARSVEDDLKLRVQQILDGDKPSPISERMTAMGFSKAETK